MQNWKRRQLNSRYRRKPPFSAEILIFSGISDAILMIMIYLFIISQDWMCLHAKLKKNCGWTIDTTDNRRKPPFSAEILIFSGISDAILMIMKLKEISTLSDKFMIAKIHLQGIQKWNLTTLQSHIANNFYIPHIKN